MHLGKTYICIIKATIKINTMTSGKCSPFCYFFLKRNLKNKKETILFQSSFIKRSPTKNVKLYGKIQGVTGNFSSHMRTRVRTHVKCLQLYHREFQTCACACTHTGSTHTIIPWGILVYTWTTCVCMFARMIHTQLYLREFQYTPGKHTHTIITWGILVDTWTTCVRMFGRMIHTQLYLREFQQTPGKHTHTHTIIPWEFQQTHGQCVRTCSHA